MLKKKIGKVNLNLISESAEEPSEIKADILRIVRDLNVIEYQGIIEEKASVSGEVGYQYLYHLSEIRSNIVSWLPIKTSDTVLECECECGAVTAGLIKKTHHVTAFTEDSYDAEIVCERFSDIDGLNVYGGDCEEILKALSEEGKTFDWIIVHDESFLKAASNLLSKKGRIIFITDNRMGLRNLAGVKAAGEDDYFTGIEGKKGTGFTYSGLFKLLESLKFKKAQLYFPYPDSLFMKNLYSNAHMPKAGELVNNDYCFSSDRYRLFSEKEAFDAACNDGSFKYYSNSYLTVIGEPLDIEYARFSNDRAPEYRIFTVISSGKDGKTVKKLPISEAAFNHIYNLKDFYSKLLKKYEGSELKINACSLKDDLTGPEAVFEYVKGVELSRLLDDALKADDFDTFTKLFDKYVSLTGFNETYPFADQDMVFSNILVDGDTWTLIDYEWCLDTKLPVKETAYRAIYCYLLEDESRKKFNVDLVLDKLVLSREAADEIELDEMSFQKKVTGKSLSLSELRERLGFKIVNPIKSKFSDSLDKQIYQFRIYPGGATGEMSEDTAFDIDNPYTSEKNAKATIFVSKDDKILRADPVNAPCLIKFNEAKLSELDFPVDSKKYLASNGKRLSKDTFLFSTNDPNLYFNIDGFIHDEDTFLYLDLDITLLSEDTAKAIEGNLKRFF